MNRVKHMILMLVGLLVLTAGFWVSPVQASQTEEKGEIRISYPIEGLKLKLYLVGTCEPGEDQKLLDPYLSYQLDESDSGMAALLASYLERDEETPIQVATTDANGLAVFTDLERGVYLICGDSVETKDAIYQSSPVMTPVLQDTKEGPRQLVEINGKYEKLPPSVPDLEVRKVWKNDSEKIRPTEITVQLLKDGAVEEEVRLNADNNWYCSWKNLDPTAKWTAVEKEVPTGYYVSVEKLEKSIVIVNDTKNPEKSDKDGGGSSGKLPRTGQLWWPVLGLITGGLFLILLGLLIRKNDQI